MPSDTDLAGPGHPAPVGDLTGCAHHRTYLSSESVQDLVVGWFDPLADPNNHAGGAEVDGVVVPPGLHDLNRGPDFYEECFYRDINGEAWIEEWKHAGPNGGHLHRRRTGDLRYQSSAERWFQGDQPAGSCL